MDWADSAPLVRKDSSGYTVIEALTPSPFLDVSGGASRPGAFVCVDGNTYWVKASTQQGLVAELVAGRLAYLVGAGPNAKIVRVTEEACGNEQDLRRLIGVGVGSLDQTDMVNARDLPPLMGPNGTFDPSVIDAASRARVISFQTWLGLGDSQVLVNLTNGHVMTIDHGECFADVADYTSAPSLIITDIPNVAADVGKDEKLVETAVRRIEALTDEQLVEAVSRIPSGDPWRSPTDRRWKIAGWLAGRRTNLRTVMMNWATS